MESVAIRSDSLLHLRDLISSLIISNPQVGVVFGMPLQVRLVIDSNYVLSELIWVARTRRDRSARTALQEAIDAGTIVAFVPHELLQEVEEHIPRLAQEENIEEDLLWQEWKEYQDKYLRFHKVDPVGDGAHHPDPDDLPFVTPARLVGAAAIASRDHHIAAMGANKIGLEVVIQHRDYSRATSIEVTFRFGTYFLTLVVAESVRVCIELMHVFARSFSKLPLWLRGPAIVALATGVGAGVAHPFSRAKMTEVAHKGSEVFEGLVPLLKQVLETMATESERAAIAHRYVEQALQDRRRVPLETVAFSVCVAAEAPLPLNEIAERVLSSGYHSTSPYFEKYLYKVMSTSGRFARGADGCWTVLEGETGA